MQQICLLIALFVAATGAALAAPTTAFTSPRLECVTSWIGNAYPGAQKWVQQDIRALTVAPDGTVFSNVEWEEGGGNVGEYRDGKLIRYARHTHGWGNLGGEAIAANSKYVFIGMQVHNESGGLKDPGTWPVKGLKWFGVSRRWRTDISKAAQFVGGKGGKGDTLKDSFLVVAEVPDGTKGPIPGLCANETRLYVADPHASQIKVYDTGSMELVSSWPVERTGPLAFEPFRKRVDATTKIRHRPGALGAVQRPRQRTGARVHISGHGGSAGLLLCA